ATSVITVIPTAFSTGLPVPTAAFSTVSSTTTFVTVVTIFTPVAAGRTRTSITAATSIIFTTRLPVTSTLTVLAFVVPLTTVTTFRFAVVTRIRTRKVRATSPRIFTAAFDITL